MKITTHTLILHVIAAANCKLTDYDIQCLLDKHVEKDITCVIYKRTMNDLVKAGLINKEIKVIEDVIGTYKIIVYSIKAL